MALSYNLKRDRDAQIFANWDAMTPDPFEQVGCDRNAILKLQREIQGRIVLPGEPDYNTDRKLTNPIFESYPQIIVYCKGGAGDVIAALNMARECGLNVRTRSGGHSTAGYSSGPGMLLDVRGMEAAHVFGQDGPAIPFARVQPGCPFRNLNDTLNLDNLHVPGGGCPDVCVAGYMQGGGFGFTSRMFGMNCDRVIGVSMVTPDGQLIRAHESKNKDLFWAVRGGTGNQFGVITEIDYGLVPVKRVWGYALSWPLSTPMQRQMAAKAMAVMQEQYMAGPDNTDIGYMTVICQQPDGTPPQPDGSHLSPYLLMRGLITGDAVNMDDTQLRERLAPLTALGGSFQWTDYDNYDNMNYRLLATPVEVPDFPKNMGEPFENKDARYVGEKTILGVGDWINLIELITLECPNPYYVMVIEPYGGAINAVGKMDTAFIHRDVAFDIFLDGYWWDPADQGPIDAWLGKFRAFMDPFWNQHVYQNYPNSNLTNYRWNYFGDAYPTLKQVKQKYDPNNLFDYPQSLVAPPAGATDGLTLSTAAPIFPESPIET